METDIQTKLAETKDWLQREFASIRTGQAAPALLDGIKVESYGSLLPLNQVGNIGVEDARTLRVQPWDTSQVKAVETAIQDADLGVSVVTDSSGLRVIFPELTAERREQLLRLAKSRLEDARIAVRGVRDEIMKALDKQEKGGELSEDQKFAEKERVQAAIDAANRELEDLFTKKQGELQQ